MAIEILVFDVDGQHFGVRSADVVQVLRAASLSPLPQAPEGIEGVLNLRGRLIPVLDTRRLLGSAAKEMDHTDHLVVVMAGGLTVAFRCDHATGLMHLECDQAEATRPGDGAGLVEMVAQANGTLIHVLHSDQLVTDPAVAALAAALVERAATEVTQ